MSLQSDLDNIMASATPEKSSRKRLKSARSSSWNGLLATAGINSIAKLVLSLFILLLLTDLLSIVFKSLSERSPVVIDPAKDPNESQLATETTDKSFEQESIDVPVADQAPTGVPASLEETGAERWCECSGSKDGSLLCNRKEKDIQLSAAERIFKRNLWRRERWIQSETADPSSLLQGRILEYYGAPLYSCFGERRFGKLSSGGQWVCRPREFLNRTSFVYSVLNSRVSGGSDKGKTKTDISFLEDLHDVTKASVHLFTPLGAAMQAMAANSSHWLTVHPIDQAVGHPQESSAIRWAEERIREKLQVQSRAASVLMVDCHLCNARNLEALITASGWLSEHVSQVLIQLSWDENPSEALDIFKSMEASGYRMFHVEKNLKQENKILLSYIHESALSYRQ